MVTMFMIIMIIIFTIIMVIKIIMIIMMMITTRYLDWNLATRGSYTSYSYDPAGQWQWLDASLQKV